MPRFSEDLSHHHILLYKGDFAKLASFYRDRSPTDIIRTLVRRHLERLEEEWQKKEMENA